MVKKDKKETNLVRSVNKNIRSSTRKLNPCLLYTSDAADDP